MALGVLSEGTEEGGWSWWSWSFSLSGLPTASRPMVVVIVPYGGGNREAGDFAPQTSEGQQVVI